MQSLRLEPLAPWLTSFSTASGRHVVLMLGQVAGAASAALFTLLATPAFAAGGPTATAVQTGTAAPACRAQASTTPPRVVELYTSEGCSSCPPADRWLSTLKGRSDVIALGYHVTYWDRLGWPDRFASQAFTQRQYEIAARHGSRSVYTPQVLVDGRDWRGWPRLPAARDGATAAGAGTAPTAAGTAAAAPRLTLSRESASAPVVARVEPVPGATYPLSGYWAVLEHDHSSRVRAGENTGETLRHDHVVRLHQAVPPFAAREGLVSRLDVPPGATAHPRRIVFVVTSPPTEQPLQALALDC